MAPPSLGGKYTLERLSLEYWCRYPLVPLEYSPQDGPPRCSGTVRGSRRNSLWENSILLLPECLDDHFIFNIFHGVITTCMCFFWEIPRIEELDNKRRSTRRGEFDSSIPEAIGVLLGRMFLARRFRVVQQSKSIPIKK